MDQRLESLTRITMRPLGSPLPLGFLAFGTGVLLLTAYEAHWIPYSEQRVVAALALGFVVPLEALASVFGFLARDTAGGTTMGLFAASWVGNALLLLLTPPDTPSHALAFLQAAIAVAALVLAIAALAAKPFFSLILLVTSARFALSCAHQLGVTGLESIATGLGLALAAMSVYGALALLIEDGRGRTVLPLFRTGKARQAIEADLDAQLRDISHEPGVRLQL